MSADNGIYILETKGPEFRVAEIMCIENIYVGNTWDEGVVKHIFKDSPVFKTKPEAWASAGELSEKKWTEYGVCLISDFKDEVFPQ